MERAAGVIRQPLEVGEAAEPTTRRTKSKASGEQPPPRPTNGAPQLVRDHLEHRLLDPRDSNKFPISSSYRPVPNNSNNLKEPGIRRRTP